MIELADQLREKYELELYAAYKQVNASPAADAKALSILEDLACLDWFRYHVAML